MDYLFNMSLKQKLQLETLKLERETLGMLLSSKDEKNMQHKMKTDSYIPMSGDTEIYANYASSGLLVQQNNTYVDKEKIWNALANISGSHGSEYEIDGKLYTEEQIPKMPSDMLETLKAQDNTLVVQSGTFYGIETTDGGTATKWGMNACGGGIKISGSETIYASSHGIALEELGEWSSFFRFLTSNGDTAGAGIYLRFSQDEVKSMLDTLGFEPGMCTINIDGEENTFYYSNNGKIYPKYHYDAIYKGLIYFDNSINYEVGDEFNFNGNIYTMDENGHINVPYGEDVLNCLSRPKTKLYYQLLSQQADN